MEFQSSVILDATNVRHWLVVIKELLHDPLFVLLLATEGVAPPNAMQTSTIEMHEVLAITQDALFGLAIIVVRELIHIVEFDVACIEHQVGKYSMDSLRKLLNIGEIFTILEKKRHGMMIDLLLEMIGGAHVGCLVEETIEFPILSPKETHRELIQLILDIWHGKFRYHKWSIRVL